MSTYRDEFSHRSTQNLADLLKSRWIPYKEPVCDQIDILGRQLEKCWHEEVKKNGRRRASLAWALLRCFGPSLIVCALWEIVAKCFFGVIVAILLGLLIGDIQVHLSSGEGLSANKTIVSESPDSTNSEHYFNADYDQMSDRSFGFVNDHRESSDWAWRSTRTQIIAKSVFLFVCLCANVLASQYYLFHSTYNGMKCRLATTYLIYRKALKISLLTLGTTTSGQIINLISNDVDRFDSAFYYMQYVYIAPLHTLVVFTIMAQFYLGSKSVLIGASLVAVYLLVQIYLGRLYGKLRSESTNRTDERVRAMGELLDSMSIIKMYGWEDHFEGSITRKRDDEMDILRQVLTLRAVNLSLYYGACKLVLMFIFVAFVLMGNEFNGIIIFTALTLTNSMRTYLTLFFPYSVATVSEIQVSMERIRQFLIQDELRPPPRPPNSEPLWPTTPLAASLSAAFSAEASQVPVALDAPGAAQASPRRAEPASAPMSSRHVHSLKMSQSLQRWHDKRRLSFITPQSGAQSPLVHQLDEPARTSSRRRQTSENPVDAAAEATKMMPPPTRLSAELPALGRLTGQAQQQAEQKWGARSATVTPFGCNVCAKFDSNHLLIDKKFAIIFHEVSVAWPKMSAEPGSSSALVAGRAQTSLASSSFAGLSSPPSSMGENSPAALTGAQNQRTIFDNLTAHIKHHEFVMIVGRVGSGKSSLLMALLNELPIQSGSIRINGSLSYASQEPWLFAGTIRENITIAWHRRAGRDYRRMPERLERRYREVLRICCLERDISIMPYGDLTNVGERGSALSGGQKARVSLARALFYDADIYLLDDPLAAVDTSVARYIFEECFRTFLKRKTVLLVTHQVQFSAPAQKVLLLHDSPHFSYGPATRVLHNLFREFNLDPAAAIPPGEGHEEQKVVQVAVNKEELQPPPARQQQPQQQDRRSAWSQEREDLPLGEIETGSLIKSLQSDELLQGINSSDDVLLLSTNTGEQQSPSGGSRPRTVDTSDSSLVDKWAETESVGQQMLDSKRTIKQVSMAQRNSAGVKSPSLRLLAEASVANDSDSAADMATYLYYRQRAAPYWLIGLFLAANLLTQLLFNGTDYFLSEWSSRSVKGDKHLGAPTNRSGEALLRLAEGTNQPGPFIMLGGGEPRVLPASSPPAQAQAPEAGPTRVFWDHLELVCGVYLLIIVLLLSASFARNMIFLRSCFNASLKIHAETLHGVLYAPMSFFERNSIGSILARFSTDLNILDDDIPQTAIDVMEIGTNVCGIVLVTAFVSWYNLVPALVVILMADYWRRSSNEAITKLKQIEAVKRGRVFSLAVSTLHGLSTIRVFRLESVINRRFEQAQNEHTHVWYSFLSGRHRLTVAIDCTSMCFFLTLIIITVLMVFNGLIEASSVGLLVSQVIILPGPLQWGARQLTDLQSYMTSLVRIRDYACTLKAEQDTMGGAPRLSRPPEGWPNAGRIRYDKVSLSYVPGTNVLHDVSFETKPGERIGIVGRTGAGKSSVIAALFRMADFRGRILIDGLDTKHIALKQLRSSLSIIPQEPVLFSGSIRNNLDPFGAHKDETIWAALQAVRLRKLVAELDGGLEAQVVEGGHNLSAGQRQLICLARAILRRNVILVLDEATANVDPETDAFIQATIREKFANCTVLTIAHRLHTIMDSDKVLVLEASEVCEFDEPVELLKRPAGFFSQMVEASGVEAAASLRRLAHEAHRKRTRLRKLRDEMRSMMTAITGPPPSGAQLAKKN